MGGGYKMKESIKVTVDIPIAWYDEKMAWNLTWRYVIKKGLEYIRHQEDKE